VATEPTATPPFDALLAKGQELLSQLAAAHERLGRELASARQQWTTERDRLGADLERLRKEHGALRLENESLRATQKSLEGRLAEVQEQGEQLKALHAHVTEQTSKLATDWNSRRQALAADNQRLTSEVEKAHRTLSLSQEREKQWKAQVWKLQDDMNSLRHTAERTAFTAEQSHHLISQLNAIIGFAEVLLDEAGNRATSAERQEFLQHIKDSGAHLATYVQHLASEPSQETVPSVGPDTASDTPRATGATVLVAATDPTVRERMESFLSRAGYQVEFTGDPAEALKTAMRLQPLAIIIDAELPPSGGQALVDQLLGESRTRDIPVMLTVRNDQEQQGAGVYDFLTKPINRQQLLQMMVKYEILADRRRANKMPTSVLIVDDDPRNTRLVEAMLKPFNINLLVARDGAAGIKLALQRKPDLIILDLMMPDVDGFEVVSALRKDSTTAQIPILIYTAKNITAGDRERLQGGIQSIIRKGELSKEQFLELIYRRGERRKRPLAEEPAA
jgi:CheY-like chemotaxis protein